MSLTYYKIMRGDGKTLHGREGWTPGQWMPALEGELVPCENGYHVVTDVQAGRWLEQGVEVWEVEVEGEIVEADDKCVCRKARLTRKVGTFTEPRWKAYKEATAPAWKAYKEATASALKAYKEADASAWKAYKEAIAPALKAYKEAIAPALKARKEADASARKAYKEADASASKARKEADASALKAYKEADASASKAYKEAIASAWKDALTK